MLLLTGVKWNTPFQNVPKCSNVPECSTLKKKKKSFFFPLRWNMERGVPLWILPFITANLFEYQLVSLKNCLEHSGTGCSKSC